MNKINNITMRDVFEDAKMILMQAGYWDANKTILSQFEIRTEALMSTTQAAFKMPILENQASNAASFPTMNLIKQTDVALVFGVNVQVGVPAAAGGALNKLFNYGNRTVFSTANSAGSVDDLYSNGFLELQLDKKVLIPYWSLQKHYKAPYTQQAANADYTASNISLVDSIDGMDGFQPFGGLTILSGSSAPVLTLNTVTAPVAVTPNSRFAVTLYSLLAQNCSNIANG